MSLDIEQIVAASFANIVAELKKPTNQWEESAALKLMQKMGCIDHVDFGEHIEVPVDYRPNPDGGVLANDQDQSPLLKTEVVTAAEYDVAQISYWVTWTKGDDAKNPSENQKIDLVKALVENGIATHDDLLEQTIFTTSAAGGVEVNGLDILVPTSGAGSPGNINAAVETWWANPSDTYTDATDIEATFTSLYNEALKGSGSALGPKFMLSGSEPHALYESVLQALQRFADVKEADGAYKTLMFKSLPYTFSQHGGTKVYFLNPKSYRMLVSREYFRDRGDTIPIPGQNAFTFPIYTAMQNIVTNKSRLAVAEQA